MNTLGSAIDIGCIEIACTKRKETKENERTIGEAEKQAASGCRRAEKDTILYDGV
jgi:hypothetical protein